MLHAGLTDETETRPTEGGQMSWAPRARPLCPARLETRVDEPGAPADVVFKVDEHARAALRVGQVGPLRVQEADEVGQHEAVCQAGALDGQRHLHLGFKV